MVLHDVFDNGQAEAGPSGMSRSGLIHAEKTFKYPIKIVFGNADTLVSDGDLDDALLQAYADTDA